MATTDPLAASDEVRERIRRAREHLDRVETQWPHGVIGDPVTARVDIVMAEHFCAAALWAIDRAWKPGRS